MNARATLHQLLYLAFIDMRVEAHEQQNKPIFYIADLLHNVPLQMERAARGECSYDEVLSYLRNRAQEKGPAHMQWLDSILEQIESYRKDIRTS